MISIFFLSNFSKFTIFYLLNAFTLDTEYQINNDNYRQDFCIMNNKSMKILRRGWTTGACATAATKAAYTLLLTGELLTSVRIILPKGQQPEFKLNNFEHGDDYAIASIIKDAGDDPDVTHGAEITVSVKKGNPGTGVIFKAGPGVGKITKSGLQLKIGEPAINPVPREMIRDVVIETAKNFNHSGDVIITISVENGEELAKNTWNPRLGILGGISILGTTGIVIPYSCSAWIHSIHRGIDVAFSNNLQHIAGCTGSTSESYVQNRYTLPDEAMIDMGDFVGGLLKYFRKKPIPRLTLGGGFGKLIKLSQGNLDLHSQRSQVNFFNLASEFQKLGSSSKFCKKVRLANTANEVLEMSLKAGLPIAKHIAEQACIVVRKNLKKTETKLNVLVIDRQGKLVGEAKN